MTDVTTDDNRMISSPHPDDRRNVPGRRDCGNVTGPPERETHTSAALFTFKTIRIHTRTASHLGGRAGTRQQACI